ncbi:MAG: ATP-binding cassette domain-containing protein [Candidatus Nealsonbacteria bacterium DGGOD1a]|nr:MAG: ATP-binding cassette domain-containing protein [Candidatus Nealsonbacteria bacterium DGGOD1a]
MKKDKIKITPKETLAKKINIPKNLGTNIGVNAGDPLVIIKDISKTYGKEELFSAARMRVMPGDRIAIVGANGMGKTTLLKIIIGIEDADEGSRELHRNARIGYLPQETHWDSLQNTVFDEIHSASPKMRDLISRKNDYEAKEKLSRLSESEVADYLKLLEDYKTADGYRYEGLIERLLIDFGFAKEAWTRTVATLSGGERTKLALAKVALMNPNMIMLDEPTNHLDIETSEWLENFLIHWNKAIVCVSHDRYFLDKVCGKTYELTKNGLEKYQCRYSEYVAEKEERRAKLEKDYKIQQHYLKEQQEFIDRFRYKATKASAVQSRIKMLEKMDKIELPKETAKDIKIRFDAGGKLCRSVLKFDGISIGPEEKPLFSLGGKLEVEWGDKVGIIGNNGMGKSTLLKSVLGKMPLLKGKITIDSRAIIGYYAQAHEELDPDKIILDEVASKTPETEEKIRSVLGALLFSPADVEKKQIRCLSGGERARVALAELILQKVNLLLLDEPTNHLDLPSKEVITKVFKEYKGTILLVSHDRYILNEACNYIWDVRDGKLTGYIGNYDDYKYHLAHIQK